jgi:hypothetical protein
MALDPKMMLVKESPEVYVRNRNEPGKNNEERKTSENWTRL